MKKLLTTLFTGLLGSRSPPEVIPEVEIVARDGLVYHQSSTEPLTGTVEEFHENGQLMIRENFIDGKQTGLHEYFHKNGQLRWRGNYKDRRQDGLWEWFDEDGNLTETRTFRNGELVETTTP